MIKVDIRKSDRCNGNCSLYLSFPFSNYIVDFVRALPSRYWNANTKEWEVSFKSLADIINGLSDYDIDVNISDPSLLISKTEDDVQIPSNFTFKTEPYSYQLDGVKYGLVHDKWLLGDMMGCISGNCKVMIKEVGKVATRDTKLSNLYKLFAKDNSIQIKCMIDGRFGYLPMKSVVYKGNKETIKITLEDTDIVCTPDHLIYTDKGWIEACQLKVGDSVFTNGQEVCKLCGSTKNLITYPYAKFNGYCKKCMYQQLRCNANVKYMNQDIVEVLDRCGYVRLKGKLTKSMPNYEHLKNEGGIYKHHQVWYENTGHIVDTKKEVVHHINGIKTDNRFENLELLSIKEHCKKHADTKSKHLYQFNPNLDYVMRKGTKIYLVPRLQKIISIEENGYEDVYDIEIDHPDIHNFICNSVVVHNCGKTKQSIDIACIRKTNNNYRHCLVVCGVNGLKWNWANEIGIHSNEQGWIIGQKTNRAGNIVIGSNAEKYEQLVDITNNPNSEISQSYFLITNIESLRNDDIVSELCKLCDNGVINMIILDEAHKALTNTTSQQGKGLLKLKAETMIAMTGTPLLNRPLDVYGILKWLGYEKHSFYSFRNHFCTMGGYGGYQVIGYKNLGELQEQLDEIMLRRRKEDVLDLPEKTYIDEYVDMTPKQAIIYKEITNEIKSNIDQIKSSANPLSEMIRMRQATGYTGILSSQIQESAKLDRMEEIVEDTIENGEKIVIFSNWTSITDEVCKRLSQKYDIAVITGDTKDEDRQRMKDKFQNDANCKVIIGTSGAMGTGLTLTAGTVEIFLDHPWNRALYEQCVDRCHRIGQKNMVTIYNILCKNTIDERVWTLVNKKGKMADALIDNGVDFSKSEMVDFLLAD